MRKQSVKKQLRSIYMYAKRAEENIQNPLQSAENQLRMDMAKEFEPYFEASLKIMKYAMTHTMRKLSEQRPQQDMQEP